MRIEDVPFWDLIKGTSRSIINDPKIEEIFMSIEKQEQKILDDLREKRIAKEKGWLEKY